MEVNNDDVLGIYNRCNRFIEELNKSQSANVNDVNEFDRARFESYLGGLTTYLDWVDAQPALDLPETSPKTLTLLDAPILTEPANLAVRDLIRLFERGRDEITNSQSARNSSGLIGFDSKRIRAVISKASNLLTEYVDNVHPIDMPESSPAQPNTGSGRTGI